MIVKKKFRSKHDNGQGCIAYEYPMSDRDINVASIEINGRYPSEGEVTNEIVKELFFVVNGKGKITIDKKEFDLEEGDAVLIRPKQRYFLSGVLGLVVSCSPAWYPEQHKHISGSNSGSNIAHHVF